MKKTARLSAKNQVTIPAEARRALGLKAGEVIIFDIDTSGAGPRVTLQRVPTLDEVAGAAPVPPEVRSLSWDEIRKRAWTPEDVDEELHAVRSS